MHFIPMTLAMAVASLLTIGVASAVETLPAPKPQIVTSWRVEPSRTDVANAYASADISTSAIVWLTCVVDQQLRPSQCSGWASGRNGPQIVKAAITLAAMLKDPSGGEHVIEPGSTVSIPMTFQSAADAIDAPLFKVSDNPRKFLTGDWLKSPTLDAIAAVLPQKITGPPQGLMDCSAGRKGVLQSCRFVRMGLSSECKTMRNGRLAACTDADIPPSPTDPRLLGLASIVRVAAVGPDGALTYGKIVRLSFNIRSLIEPPLPIPTPISLR